MTNHGFTQSPNAMEARAGPIIAKSLEAIEAALAEGFRDRH